MPHNLSFVSAVLICLFTLNCSPDSGSDEGDGGSVPDASTEGELETEDHGGTATGSESDTDTGVTLGPQCENEEPEPVSCGQTCQVIENNGPSTNRVSLSLIGDGFTESELENKYQDLAYDLADYMFNNSNDSEPYVRYRRFINFYRIDLVSNESGVDQPSKNVWVDTPLDGEDGCTDWTIGMCQVNWEKTHNAIEDAMKDSHVTWTDWRLVTLNSNTDCGGAHYPARGTLAVYCPYKPQSPDIALHEAGHAFHRLADTYWTLEETFTDSEPTAVNLTKDPSGKKWSHWLGYDEPILGKIGAYEGGGQYHYGIYRPSYNQKMGSAEYCHMPGPPYCPHDAVSREKIILDIYDVVDPLDDWTDNSSTLKNPEALSVDVVDCDVIKVNWYVDDTLVAENYGEIFRLAEHGLTSGKHTVEARAYDDTKWVRQDRSALNQTVIWEIDLD